MNERRIVHKTVRINESIAEAKILSVYYRAKDLRYLYSRVVSKMEYISLNINKIQYYKY